MIIKWSNEAQLGTTRRSVDRLLIYRMLIFVGHTEYRMTQEALSYHLALRSLTSSARKPKGTNCRGSEITRAVAYSIAYRRDSVLKCSQNWLENSHELARSHTTNSDELGASRVLPHAANVGD